MLSAFARRWCATSLTHTRVACAWNQTLEPISHLLPGTIDDAHSTQPQPATTLLFRHMSSSTSGPSHEDETAGEPGAANLRPSLADLRASLGGKLHSTSKSHAGPHPAQPGVKVDLFTQALQQKAEQQLRDIIANTRDAKLAGQGRADAQFAAQAEDAAEEAEEEFEPATNPKTGEYMGPRGKEPTRYGDWERQGRCTDF